MPNLNGEPGGNTKIDVDTVEGRFVGKGIKRRALSLHVVYAKERSSAMGDLDPFSCR